MEYYDDVALVLRQDDYDKMVDFFNGQANDKDASVQGREVMNILYNADSVSLIREDEDNYVLSVWKNIRWSPYNNPSIHDLMEYIEDYVDEYDYARVCSKSKRVYEHYDFRFLDISMTISFNNFYETISEDYWN